MNLYEHLRTQANRRTFLRQASLGSLALAGLMNLFHYLKIGLSIVLTFVGVKMLLVEIFPIPIGITLSIVGGVLLLSIAASIYWPVKKQPGK